MYFFEFGQHLGIVGQNAPLVLFQPAQNALLVHDKDRPVRGAYLGIEDPVLLGDLAVGPEIRDQRIRNPSECFAPRLLGRNGIAADSQYLAIYPIELGALRLVRRDLAVSARGKGEWVKREHHALLPAILAQLDIQPRDFRLGNHRRGREIRRRLSDREDVIRHCASHDPRSAASAGMHCRTSWIEEPELFQPHFPLDLVRSLGDQRELGLGFLDRARLESTVRVDKNLVRRDLLHGAPDAGFDLVERL